MYVYMYHFIRDHFDADGLPTVREAPLRRTHLVGVDPSLVGWFCVACAS